MSARVSSVAALSRFASLTDPAQFLAIVRDELGQRAPLPTAVARHLDAVVAHPGEALPWGRLGQSCLQAGAPRAAAAAFRTLLALEGRSAEGAASLGVALAASGEDAKAEEALRAALDADPGLLPAWQNPGNCLLRKGDNEEALACFDRALALRADYAPAWIGRGQAVMAMGRGEEGEESLRQAVGLDPREVMALAMRSGPGEPMFSISKVSLEYLRGRADRQGGEEE